MKIEWRQLLLVAVVAAVFGGGAGYLAGGFGREEARSERSSPQTYRDNTAYGSSFERTSLGGFLEEREERQRQQDLDRRLQCIENKAEGGSNRIGPCY